MTDYGSRPARVEDVHDLAAAMPHVTVERGTGGNPIYQVGGKSFVFFRNPRPDAVDRETGERYRDVVVFWVSSEGEKQALVQDESSPFFTTAHFDGHPSVLLRASRIGDLIAVLLHQDDMALRYALAAAHFAPDVPVVAAIFDATVSEQLERLLPNCVVTSPGELAAPVLAAACLGIGADAIVPEGRRRGKVFRVDEAGVVAGQWTHGIGARLRVVRGRVAGQLRPHDPGSRILFAGLFGMLVAVVSDWVWLMSQGAPPAEAFHEAARVVATVGPASHHDAAYAVFSGIAMLLTVVFAGMFTAGVVELLLGPRLVGLFGQRALPRGDHVVVVGLGQVGLRLCRHLQALGVPVVGVERDSKARYLTMARNLGIPVIVGHGGDRLVLERLRLDRARALAAVGSADLDNISVAVAARGIAPDTGVVVRAGEHEVLSETASLLPLGETRDVTRLSSAYVVARLLGIEAVLALPHGENALLRTAAGEFMPWTTSRRDECGHVNAAADARVLT